MDNNTANTWRFVAMLTFLAAVIFGWCCLIAFIAQAEPGCK